jgi:hypothetical protein
MALWLIHQVPEDPVNYQTLTRAQIPSPSIYLLRPDGHIGLTGTRLEPAVLARYVTERVKLRNAGGT